MIGATGNGAGGWFFSRAGAAGVATWVALWIFSIAAIPAGATVYVDRDAPGPIRDGASWTTAFVEIQDAVDAAAAKPGGDEVWVAQGVYPGDILTSSGVRLYGGFLGADAPTTETALDQRDWVNNVTALSGSSTDRLLDFDAATTVGIDGFTFAAGTDYAIVGTSANARIAHCRFPGNSTGIHWWNPCAAFAGEVVLEDCHFEDNGTALDVQQVRALRLDDCQIERAALYAISGSAWNFRVENSMISDTMGIPLDVGRESYCTPPVTAPEEPSQAILRNVKILRAQGVPYKQGSLREFSHAVIENCDVVGNRNPLLLSACSVSEVTGCRFLGNIDSALSFDTISSAPTTGSIRNCLFQDNGWPLPGSTDPVLDSAVRAAIFIEYSGGLFHVEDCQFLHNATENGAIFSGGHPLDVRDCVFRDNLCLAGGCIDVYATHVVPDTTTISRCVFENNTSGHAMVDLMSSHAMVVEDTRIVNNTGGGMIFQDDRPSRVAVSRCLIENNSSDSCSGIGVTASRVVIVDTVIRENETVVAPIDVYSADEVEISGCRILNNSTQHWTAGLSCIYSSRVRVTDCQIVGNSLEDAGAAVEISPVSDVEITNSIIAGNRAKGNSGGGLWLGGANDLPGSRVTRCLVAGNQGSDFGFGIYISDYGRYRIEDSVIAGQRGAIAHGVDASSVTPVGLANCTVFGNAGTHEGIGIATGTTLDVSNTVVARNSTYGVGQYGQQSASRFTSCLFHGNTADYFDHQSGSTITGAAAINALPNYTGALNSGNVEGDPRFVPGIRGVWAADGAYDSATSRTVLTVGSADAAFTTDSLIGRLIVSNNDYEDLYVILSNTPTQLTVLGDATAFAPAGRAFEILDFHLDPSYCSPALDTGTDLNAPNVDLDGAPRPVDLPGIGADGTGTTFDIGAYELQETTPTHRLVVAPQSVDFGTAVIGEASIPTTITLTNTGTAAVSFRGQGLVIAGADADQFSLLPPDLDPIAPCETRLAFVSFSPSAAGTHSATLRVLTDDDLAPAILVSLAGEAIAPTPTPTETPTPTATPAGPDADHDGISDVYERAHGSDPYDPASLPMNLDLDGNGLVDRDDALGLYQVLSGRISANPDADYDSMDFNGDGVTNILDALLFYRNRAGVIPMIPLAE